MTLRLCESIDAVVGDRNGEIGGGRLAEDAAQLLLGARTVAELVVDFVHLVLVVWTRFGTCTRAIDMLLLYRSCGIVDG